MKRSEFVEHIAWAGAGIARLTPLQAQMVEYAYYRSMTLSEIAAELNKPIGTVKSHISAALRALRKALQDDGAVHV